MIIISKYNFLLLFILITAICIALASASGLSLQPLRLNDIITLIASIDYELFHSLQYMKDYATSSSTFLIKVIEEAVTSEHNNVINLSSTFQYKIIQEEREEVKDHFTIRSKFKFSIEEEEEGEEEEGKEGRGKEEVSMIWGDMT